MSNFVDFRPAGLGLVCLPQIGPEHVAWLGAQGFRSIVCNRPDSEPGAVASAQIAAAAQQQGLQFAYLPVAFSTMTSADGAAFAQLLAQLPGPVAAYCRTGRRSAGLWALGQAPKDGVDATLQTTRAAGCDLEDLRPRLG